MRRGGEGEIFSTRSWARFLIKEQALPYFSKSNAPWLITSYGKNDNTKVEGLLYA